MRTRPLGSSGIEAPSVAFGAWAIGGWMWGGTDKDDSINALHASIDAGATLIDTAPIYGLGLSEELVGAAVKDRRDKVIIATKCGMVTDLHKGEKKFKADVLGPNPNGLMSVRIWLHPDSIKQEVEGSLKRLQTDYIDLYQTHWQEGTTPIEDTMSALLELKKDGKIRAIGVSNATSAQMAEYAAVGPLDSDQEKFNMLDREIEDDQLPYCRENGVAVLAYSPIAQGLLTGKLTPDREFGPGDIRTKNPRYSVENRKRIQTMLDKFKPVADAHGITLAQLAIAWTVHQPGLTHALCGARTAQQAVENAGAGDVRLSDDELGTMNAAIDEYTKAAAA